MSEEKNNNQVQQEINRLVENGLKALDEFRLLNQEQVDYIVAKASVAALDQHGVLAQHAIEETGRGVRKTYLPANTWCTTCVTLKQLALFQTMK